MIGRCILAFSFHEARRPFRPVGRKFFNFVLICYLLIAPTVCRSFLGNFWMAVINTELAKVNIYLVPMENFWSAIRKTLKMSCIIYKVGTRLSKNILEKQKWHANLAYDLELHWQSNRIFFLRSNQRMIASFHAKVILHVGFAWLALRERTKPLLNKTLSGHTLGLLRGVCQFFL